MLLLYFLLHINHYLNKHIYRTFPKLYFYLLLHFILFLFSVPKKKKKETSLTHPLPWIFAMKESLWESLYLSGNLLQGRWTDQRSLECCTLSSISWWWERVLWVPWLEQQSGLDFYTLHLFVVFSHWCQIVMSAFFKLYWVIHKEVAFVMACSRHAPCCFTLSSCLTAFIYTDLSWLWHQITVTVTV